MSRLWSSATIGLAGVLLGGIPTIAVFWSSRFERLRIQRKAARGLGASEWRIFWRVTLPGAWVQFSIGLLLAAAAAALIVVAST
jgi:ABC-type spermidine/putrescine transport system permease subunit II